MEPVKPLQFLGSSKADLMKFPKAVQQSIGFELTVVQHGGTPKDYKPMPNIGVGVCELRIRHLGQWRAIYLANRADAVYVLHVFQKKTQKTGKPDLDLAKNRLKILEQL